MARPSSDRPRVLFVINSLAGGGAERVMLSLIAASEDLRDRYEIALALLDREPFAYAPPGWLTVHQLDGRFSLARSAARFVRLVARERPDVTLSFLTRSNMVAVLAAKLFGHRAIISERANTSGHFKPGASGAVAKRLIRMLYPRADAVIAVSRGIADDLRDRFGVDAAKLDVIANPVDGDAIRAAAAAPPAITSERPYLVAVSRLTKGKNVALLVDALARARTELDLLILGQGPERAAIEARAAELGVAARVRPCGFQENPYAIMRGARAYVSASNGEGFPNGLVEALALGLPAIATNCASGPSEILADLRREEVDRLTFAPFGVLVPPNDADGFARAVEAVTSKPGRHAALSAAGPKRAADYGTGRAKAAYWSVIDRALASRPRRRARTAAPA